MSWSWSQVHTSPDWNLMRSLGPKTADSSAINWRQLPLTGRARLKLSVAWNYKRRMFSFFSQHVLQPLTVKLRKINWFRCSALEPTFLLNSTAAVFRMYQQADAYRRLHLSLSGFYHVLWCFHGWIGNIRRTHLENKIAPDKQGHQCH